MRRKPNLGPRLARCAAVLAERPEENRGRWRALLPGCEAIHLELGCGKGRFTAETARQNPKILLLAVERVPGALVIATERAAAEGLLNVRFLPCDAACLADVFAPGEIARIYLNFPDPWPKNRQSKRRLTAPDFLALYRALLPPGGELHLRTDNLPLFDWSAAQLARGGFTLRELTHDLHAAGPAGVMTDYEARFYARGVPIRRLAAVRDDDRR